MNSLSHASKTISIKSLTFVKIGLFLGGTPPWPVSEFMLYPCGDIGRCQTFPPKPLAGRYRGGTNFQIPNCPKLGDQPQILHLWKGLWKRYLVWNYGRRRPKIRLRRIFLTLSPIGSSSNSIRASLFNNGVSWYSSTLCVVGVEPVELGGHRSQTGAIKSRARIRCVIGLRSKDRPCLPK